MITRLFRAATLTAVISAMLFSCTSDEKLHKTGSEAATTFKIGTRALNTSDPDSKIVRLRVMAFSKMTGNISSNKLYSTEQLVTNPITHTIKTGTYDFVFIANEPQAITATLEGVKRANALSNIVLAASSFIESEDIPMYKRYDNVTVLADDEGISVDGGATLSTWAVKLDRLAIRMSVTLTADSDLGTLTGVTFSNLPQGVVLTGENYTGTWSEANNRTVTAGFEPLTAPELTTAGAAWGRKTSTTTRIILPANIFTPETTEAKAVRMTVNFSDDSSYTGTLGYNPQLNNFSLPANNHYTINFKLERGGGTEVRIEAEDWDSVDVEGDLLNRILNVSTIKANITDNTPARIYFWSNQQNVFVEKQGYYGTTLFDDVNLVFDNLWGDPATNVVYADDYSGDGPANSVGYIEITPAAGLTYDQNGAYKIYLNAGGLKREITVNLNLNSPMGVCSDVLYFDASGTMRVGKYGIDFYSIEDMAFFKFGSVVGFTNGDDWNDVTSIKFNPTSTASYAFANIPVYSVSDYNDYRRNISAPNYHYAANVKAGKGDPCKLAGLDLNKIKTTDADDLTKADIDNGLWRLPTAQDNARFVQGPYLAWKTWTVGDTSYAYGQNADMTDPFVATFWQANDMSVDNPGYAWFPVIQGPTPNTAGVFLPAAGVRDPYGSVLNQGTVGCYWTSEPLDGRYSSAMSFISGGDIIAIILPVVFANYTDPNFPGPPHSQGYSIRCVRQQ